MDPVIWDDPGDGVADDCPQEGTETLRAIDFHRLIIPPLSLGAHQTEKTRQPKAMVAMGMSDEDPCDTGRFDHAPLDLDLCALSHIKDKDVAHVPQRDARHTPTMTDQPRIWLRRGRPVLQGPDTDGTSPNLEGNA